MSERVVSCSPRSSVLFVQCSFKGKQVCLSVDPTRRFSNRVENYVRYRPGYPPEILPMLQREVGLSRSTVITDIGSGTGISAAFFLKNGNKVFAVEPNEKMRRAAESQFKDFPLFTSIDGTAEHTTLEAASVDLVVAAQAFHWFDKKKAKREFQRILKLGGRIVLMWNSRRIDSTPFAARYEALLRRYATDYDLVNHKNIDESILGDFYAPHGFQTRKVFHPQMIGYEVLEGRLLSASYIPPESDSRFQPLLADLRTLFDRYQTNGTITIEYDTELYIGNL